MHFGTPRGVTLLQINIFWRFLQMSYGICFSTCSVVLKVFSVLTYFKYARNASIAVPLCLFYLLLNLRVKCTVWILRWFLIHVRSMSKMHGYCLSNTTNLCSFKRKRKLGTKELLELLEKKQRLSEDNKRSSDTLWVGGCCYCVRVAEVEKFRFLFMKTEASILTYRPPSLPQFAWLLNPMWCQ